MQTRAVDLETSPWGSLNFHGIWYVLFLESVTVLTCLAPWRLELPILHLRVISMDNHFCPEERNNLWFLFFPLPSVGCVWQVSRIVMPKKRFPEIAFNQDMLWLHGPNLMKTRIGWKLSCSNCIWLVSQPVETCFNSKSQKAVQLMIWMDGWTWWDWSRRRN